MQRTMMLVLGVVWMMGCGGAEPAPQLAPDRTAPGADRNTKVTTCQWVPALPEDHGEPCNHDNQGAELKLTERADMREESRTEQTHTCVCN